VAGSTSATLKKAFVVSLARRLEVEGVLIGQAQLHQRARRALVFALPLLQRQRLGVVCDGLAVGIRQPGLVAGQEQVTDSRRRQRPVYLPALVKVKGKLASHCHHGRAVEPFHRLTRPGVEVLPVSEWDSGVHNLLDLVMGEGVVAAQNSAALGDEPAPEEHVQGFEGRFLTLLPRSAK